MKLKILKNGPILVTGGVPLDELDIVSNALGIPDKYEVTKKHKVADTYSLCRCGKSSKMPFCDGTHSRENFNGKETASNTSFKDIAEKTEGPKHTLLDVEEICAGARFCNRAGGTWDLVKKDDKHLNDIAIQEVADCPAGRLVIVDKKTGKDIEPDFKPSISILNDPFQGVMGPIWVKGGIEIEGSDGTIYEKRNRVTLCRCGKSKNKPLCDGEHLP